MTKYQAINKFHVLRQQNKSAALDIHDQTGELVCRFTISNSQDKIEGNGTPPIPFSENWLRIIECREGVLLYDP